MARTRQTRSPLWPRAVASVIVGLFAVLVVVKFTLAPRLPRDLEYDVLDDVGLSIAFGTFSLVGAFLIWRQPRNRLSWMVGAVGSLTMTFVTLDTYGAWLQITGREVDAIAAFGFWGQGWYWFLLISLILVFVPLHLPDGRLPSPRWRPWVAFPLLGTAAMTIAGMTAPTMRSNSIDGPALDNPIGVSWMPGVETELGFLFLSVLFGIGLAVISLIVRFRRSTGVERQQLKVMLFSAALLPLIPLSEYVPFLDASIVFPVLVAAVPISIGVAVVRYRLYDIDRIISRTVAYLLVTAVLVGVFAGGVLGIGSLLPGERSDLLVAGTTLVVAAMFRPLASRVRALVDRRFNRARYDAGLLVEQFGRRLRDHVDLDDIASELGTTVGAALQPRRVAVVHRQRVAP